MVAGRAMKNMDKCLQKDLEKVDLSLQQALEVSQPHRIDLCGGNSCIKSGKKEQSGCLMSRYLCELSKSSQLLWLITLTR